MNDEARRIFPITGSANNPHFKDFRPKPVVQQEQDPKASSAQDSVQSSPEQQNEEDLDWTPSLEDVKRMTREAADLGSLQVKASQGNPATAEKASTPKISAPSMPPSSTKKKTGPEMPRVKT